MFSSSNVKRIFIIAVMSISLLFLGCANKIDISKAIQVEESLVRNDGKFVLIGAFNNYYNLKNTQNENIPMLLQVRGEMNSLEEGKVSDRIDNLQFAYYGISGDLEIELIADNSYFYVMKVTGENDLKDTTSSINNEPEIAYLKREYSDFVDVLKMTDENIEYRVRNNYDPEEYRVLVVIEKDTVNGKISITIQDEADTIRM